MLKISSTIFIVGAVVFGFFVSESISLVVNTLNNLKPEIVDLSDRKPNLLVAKASTSAGLSEKKYVTKNDAVFPSVSAKSYIVADLLTGDVIASKRPDQIYPIASITKVMTAIVSEDVYGDETLVVSKEAIETYGKQGNLRVGEKYTVKEMLYPMMLESSNDAAEVLALHEDRPLFLKAMNAKAKLIGLERSEFDDASGLSPGNTSTVTDLFKLAQFVYKERQHLLEMSKLKNYSLRGKVWNNINKFKGDSYFIGGKNGYTDVALQTHFGLFKLPLEGENKYRDIAIIVLKSDEAVNDTRKIISHLNKNVYFER